MVHERFCVELMVRAVETIYDEAVIAVTSSPARTVGDLRAHLRGTYDGAMTAGRTPIRIRHSGQSATARSSPSRSSWSPI